MESIALEHLSAGVAQQLHSDFLHNAGAATFASLTKTLDDVSVLHRAGRHGGRSV